MTIKKFCNWVSLFAKVKHINYTMGTRPLPDIYTPGIYQQPEGKWYICNSYTMGMGALPDIRTCPRAIGPRASVYISGKA